MCYFAKFTFVQLNVCQKVSYVFQNELSSFEKNMTFNPNVLIVVCFIFLKLIGKTRFQITFST